MKNTFSLSREMPFADLMLHPEKVDAVLKSAKKTKANTASEATSSRGFGHHAKSRMSGNR